MNENKYLEQKNEMIGENSFMKALLKKRLNQKGLTLIELLAVIVILAIVAAIAVPAIGNLIQNSRYNAVKADALNVLSAANIYFAENSAETDVTVAELKTAKLLDTSGKILDTVGSDASTIIKPTSGTTGALELSTGALKFSGDKTVTFTSATVDAISGDTTKGSAVSTNVTINKSGVTVAGSTPSGT